MDYGERVSEKKSNGHEKNGKLTFAGYARYFADKRKAIVYIDHSSRSPKPYV